MEIEIVTFVVKGSTKLTVPTDWQEQIKVGSKSVALRRVFDLKLRGIHLTEIILKVWVINGQNVVDVSICEIELRWITLSRYLVHMTHLKDNVVYILVHLVV